MCRKQDRERERKREPEKKNEDEKKKVEASHQSEEDKNSFRQLLIKTTHDCKLG